MVKDLTSVNECDFIRYVRLFFFRRIKMAYFMQDKNSGPDPRKKIYGWGFQFLHSMSNSPVSKL